MQTLHDAAPVINGKSTAELLKIVPTSALEGELARRRAEARSRRRQKDAVEGAKLRVLRESMGLSQFECAKYLNVAQSALCWAETGRRSGAVAMLKKLQDMKEGSEKNQAQRC